VAGVANSLERSEAGGYKTDRERTICDMQAELASAEQDVGSARTRMADILARIAIREATGEDVDTVVVRPDTSGSWGLGRLYCSFLGAIDSSLIRRSISGSAVFGGRQFHLGDHSVPEFDAVEGELDALQTQIDSRLRDRNAFDVEIQKKFSIAVACVVFILIGAPVALRFPRGGVGLVIGVSLTVFALYYVGLIAGEDLADENIVPPVLAMWITNLVLTIVGLVLLLRMGREGSTARGGDLSELLDAGRAWLARIARRVGIPTDRRRHAP
jgi:lipopolysaccharide export system permease protein